MARAVNVDDMGNPIEDTQEDPYAQWGGYDNWITQNNIAPEMANPAVNQAPAAGSAPDMGGQTAAPATGGFDRTQFRDSWQSSAAGQSPTDFIAQNPSFSTGVTPYQGSKDKFVLPTGEVLDLSINANAQGVGGKGWTGMGFNAQGVPDSPGGESGGFGQLGEFLNRLQQGGVSNGFQQQIRDMLLQRLGQLQNAGDPSQSPEYQQQYSAAERSAERVRRRSQDANAERLTQQGLGDSGALDSSIAQGYENMSENLSGLSGDLVGRIMTQRRDELNNLLQMALQTGDAESARQLQMELATMNAELQRAGLAQSGQQFNAQLGQQQSQFSDNLGFQEYQYNTDDAYRKAVLAAMGGA